MIRSGPRLYADPMVRDGPVERCGGLLVALGLLLAGLLALLIAGLIAVVLPGDAAPVEHIQLLAPMRWDEVSRLA